jgi:hypothetical protein
MRDLPFYNITRRKTMKDFREFLVDCPGLEAIEMEHLGVKRFVLLRSKRIPEMAIMIDSLDKHGTMFSVQFVSPVDAKTLSQDFSIACACCPIQASDAEKPDGVTGDGISTWWASFQEPFKQLVAKTCREHGIKTVLMRRGEVWDEKFGYIDGVDIWPFREFFDFYCKLKILQEVFEGVRFGH